MKKRSFVLITLSLAPILVFGQDFSLRQCIDYATKSNGNIISADYDVDIAGRKVKEQIGGMLPQIDGSGTYTDNLMLATTLLPGEMAGKPGTKIPITFGTKHNMMGTLQLTQKIFDPTFGVALKAAKLSENQAMESLRLTMEQASFGISLTYYQSLVIAKQLGTLRSTLATSGKLLQSTELRFKNGMAKQLDVDKIRVSYNNLQSQVQQCELNYSQSLNNLKLYMGMPVEKPISLTDTVMSLDEQVLEAGTGPFDVRNRTDYRLQEIAVQAYQADKIRNQSGYLPTLSFSANLGSNAMRSKFNFLDNSEKWYNSSSINFSLRVPIFDGLQRQQRIAQSKLNIQKAKAKVEQAEQSMKVDVANYENQYQTAINNIRNEKANVDLAEKVYKNSQLMYSQGMCTSLELVQAESSFSESMNNYYARLLNLYIARVNLEQSKGNLLNYINNK
jgi:outer membrane protein TolC